MILVNIIVALGIFSHYSPRFQRIIVNYIMLMMMMMSEENDDANDIDDDDD